ncbi:hypothetical protein KOW79_011894 [Hemibagrus wyckioides]|uniref:Uncharacterized protein n=1 Tax=Hemibagrus wyckioides TaxID=337641 RepID=A0A9D3NME3_9TELE|nr:hypothetical protein KOW79_011894 [Hemibagrus wyckioides]
MRGRLRDVMVLYYVTSRPPSDPPQILQARRGVEASQRALAHPSGPSGPLWLPTLPHLRSLELASRFGRDSSRTAWRRAELRQASSSAPDERDQGRASGTRDRKRSRGRGLRGVAREREADPRQTSVGTSVATVRSPRHRPRTSDSRAREAGPESDRRSVNFAASSLPAAPSEPSHFYTDHGARDLGADTPDLKRVTSAAPSDPPIFYLLVERPRRVHRASARPSRRRGPRYRPANRAALATPNSGRAPPAPYFTPSWRGEASPATPGSTPKRRRRTEYSHP